MNARLSLLLCVTVLFGCAAQVENQQSVREISRESENELREYLDKAMLEEVSVVRAGDSWGWEYVNDYFVIVEARKDLYLPDLDNLRTA